MVAPCQAVILNREFLGGYGLHIDPEPAKEHEGIMQGQPSLHHTIRLLRQ
jgi:hypothetical protein